MWAIISMVVFDAECDILEKATFLVAITMPGLFDPLWITSVSRVQWSDARAIWPTTAHVSIKSTVIQCQVYLTNYGSRQYQGYFDPMPGLFDPLRLTLVSRVQWSNARSIWPTTAHVSIKSTVIWCQVYLTHYGSRQYQEYSDLMPGLFDRLWLTSVSRVQWSDARAIWPTTAHVSIKGTVIWCQVYLTHYSSR